MRSYGNRKGKHKHDTCLWGCCFAGNNPKICKIRELRRRLKKARKSRARQWARQEIEEQLE